MNKLFSHTILAGALCLSAGSALATTNLVTNGSFVNGLTGWTQIGTPAAGSSTSNNSANPISLVTYNSTAPYPNGSAYGESIPTDTCGTTGCRTPSSATVASNAAINSDTAGNQAAYFVDDHAVNQGLQQYITLAAGNYQIGFDVYIPNNGQNNTGPASFSATIANYALTTFNVGSSLTGTWYNVAGNATVASTNNYLVSFIFNSGVAGVVNDAKDVVIDRVYVTAGGPGGRVLPEPGTLPLFGIAFAGLAATRMGKKKKA